MTEANVNDEAALLQDTRLLEFIGSFKEYVTERAQKMIDTYHIPGKFEGKTSPASRFPFGVSDVPNVVEDGIVYRLATNYNGISDSFTSRKFFGTNYR
jgi:hypothetical protein